MMNKHLRTEQDPDCPARRKMTHTFNAQHKLVSLEQSVPLPASQPYSLREKSEKHGRPKGGKNHPEKLTDLKRLQGKLDRLKRAEKLGKKMRGVTWTNDDAAKYACLKEIHQQNDGRRRPEPLHVDQRDIEARAAWVKAMLDPTKPCPFPVAGPGSFPKATYFDQVNDLDRSLNCPGGAHPT